VCCNQNVTCVQNKTVVTNALKDEDLNNYLPLFKKYNIAVLYNFQPGDMTWIKYRPKAKMLVLAIIFPKGIFPGIKAGWHRTCRNHTEDF
jgi:hypothetical protein